MLCDEAVELSEERTMDWRGYLPRLLSNQMHLVESGLIQAWMRKMGESLQPGYEPSTT